MEEGEAGIGTLVVVLGPTASGKSAVATELARRYSGEIINADSRQVYRGLDIGTAKPTTAERALMPHHLYDVVEPSEVYSAAIWAKQADAAITDVAARGRVAIVVGGTGLYLRALLDGLFAGPARSSDHARLERVAARRGLSGLRRWLERVDPEWARAIAPGDRQRLLRGLDVYLQTGRPMSALIAESRKAPRYQPLKLGIAWPGPELHVRIAQRVTGMLEEGLCEEVRRLRSVTGFPGSNAARSVGYREVDEVLAGTAPAEGLEERIARATRQLAKRQMTWFRREAGVRWLTAEAGALPHEEARDVVASWLERRHDTQLLRSRAS